MTLPILPARDVPTRYIPGCQRPVGRRLAPGRRPARTLRSDLGGPPPAVL